MRSFVASLYRWRTLKLLSEVFDREHIRRVYIGEPAASAAELSQLRTQLAEARSARDELQGRLDRAHSAERKWLYYAKERSDRAQAVQHEANQIRQELQAALSERDSLCARVKSLTFDVELTTKMMRRAMSERIALRAQVKALVDGMDVLTKEKTPLESGLTRATDALNRAKNAGVTAYTHREIAGVAEQGESDDGTVEASDDSETDSSKGEAAYPHWFDRM